MKTICLCMAVALLCLACSKKSEYDNEDNASVKNMEIAYCSMAPATAEELVKYTPPNIKDDEISETRSENKVLQKKIIKDGNISIEVIDVILAKKKLDTTLKKFAAYYENEEFQNTLSAISYRLKIRVPSNMFESLLMLAESGGGKVTYKDINTRDVSEDYYDSEIRLESKQLFRTRYNELLLKASKVPDILDIEENLRVIQEEIESQQGHLRYLNDQVMYSTLDIKLFVKKEEKEKAIEISFVEKLTHSLGNGWKSVVNGLLWLITQWPWLLIAFTLIISTKRYFKYRRAKAI